MLIAAAPTEAADTDPFLALIEPLLPAGYRLAYAMLRSQAEAEDALQEALLRAWAARARMRPDTSPRPWFLTIVANQCRQQRRSRWWSVLKRADLPDGPTTPEDAISGDPDLHRALARLPHRHRLVLVLRYYLDLSFEDIGRVQGVSTGAAKARVHRALRHLRAEVPEDLNDA
ncbi:MAG TPA: RNA polymerase sigma factor [Candidatus Dormibacteraeota bacterium]|nr:RNA polymerase sigma factor [Candidatus Dormibacteraeota bacterium]